MKVEELIERLRNQADWLDGTLAVVNLMGNAADALAAQADRMKELESAVKAAKQAESEVRLIYEQSESAETAILQSQLTEAQSAQQPYDTRQFSNLMNQANGYTQQPEGRGAEGQPYGIIDPDYARVYTQARIVAWQYGYACVMHGSFTRDLDLLLVPWTEQARDNHDQRLLFKDGVKQLHKAVVDWSEKPHGRKSCSLYFPTFGDRRWIDVSVVPHATPRQSVNAALL
jgi:hypothetical protein